MSRVIRLTPIQYRVVFLQDQLGLDDKGLGRQLGVASVSIWRWRVGRAEPKGKRLEKLMKLWEMNGGARGA